MTDRDDRGESRRQIARRQQRKAGDRSSRLANVIMRLPVATLGRLGLDEDLREVIDRARAVTSMVARRRAERALAGSLRRIDLVELDARIANVEEAGAVEPRMFQLAEQWRTRLIEEGLAAVAEFPGAGGPPLPDLIERAQRERTTGRPPGASRALFRHVLTALKAQPRDPPTSAD